VNPKHKYSVKKIYLITEKYSSLQSTKNNNYTKNIDTKRVKNVTQVLKAKDYQ